MNLLIPFPLTRINENTHIIGYNGKRPTADIISNNIPRIDDRKSNQWQSKFYKFFGIDIVSETVFDYPYPYISEKTLRPISSKRPFIILGAPFTLFTLKQKGFKTFDSIIDESYDQVKNSSDRFHAVCNSFKKFTTQPIEKIKEDVKSISHILDYNFIVLKNLEDKEINELEKRFSHV
jgi:hypothetical protein